MDVVCAISCSLTHPMHYDVHVMDVQWYVWVVVRTYMLQELVYQPHVHVEHHPHNHYDDNMQLPHHVTLDIVKLNSRSATQIHHIDVNNQSIMIATQWNEQNQTKTNRQHCHCTIDLLHLFHVHHIIKS